MVVEAHEQILLTVKIMPSFAGTRDGGGCRALKGGGGGALVADSLAMSLQRGDAGEGNDETQMADASARPLAAKDGRVVQ